MAKLFTVDVRVQVESDSYEDARSFVDSLLNVGSDALGNDERGKLTWFSEPRPADGQDE